MYTETPGTGEMCLMISLHVGMRPGLGTCWQSIHVCINMSGDTSMQTVDTR